MHTKYEHQMDAHTTFCDQWLYYIKNSFSKPSSQIAEDISVTWPSQMYKTKVIHTKWGGQPETIAASAALTLPPPATVTQINSDDI